MERLPLAPYFISTWAIRGDLIMLNRALILVAAASTMWSAQLNAQGPEFERLIRLWDAADPAPTIGAFPPGAVEGMENAANQACAEAQAHFLTLSRRGVSGADPAEAARAKAEYTAATQARDECKRQAAVRWSDENVPGFRAYRAWSERDEERRRKAYRGELRPPPPAASAGSVASSSPPPAALSETAVPPLRQTVAQEAHNPANEASQCIKPIFASQFEAMGVRSNMGAVFRNSCAFPVEVVWCESNSICARGFTNVGTFPANADRSISYTAASPGAPVENVHWGACRQGFVPHQSQLSPSRQYACR